MKKKIIIPIIVVATCAIGAGGYAINKSITTETKTVQAIVAPTESNSQVNKTKEIPKNIPTTATVTSTPKVVESKAANESAKVTEHSNKKVATKTPVVTHTKSESVPSDNKSISSAKEHKPEESKTHTIEKTNQAPASKSENTQDESHEKIKTEPVHHTETKKDTNSESVKKQTPSKTETNNKPKEKPKTHSGTYIEGIGTPADAIAILKKSLGTEADKYIYVEPQAGHGRYFVSTRLKGKQYAPHYVQDTYVINATSPRVQEVG